MKNLRMFKLGFLIALLFGASSVFSQINPINTLESPNATACGVYDVDLSVQQYINVANISMTLDISSLTSAYTGITLNPVISSAFTYVNSEGKLKLGWSSDPDPANALTLPDNTVLFTLHFDIGAAGLWGTTHDLAWDDVLTIDCELSGPNGSPIYPDYWNDLHWEIQNQMSLSETHIDYECPLSPTGAIDLTVAGGVAPYTFQWTGPDGFTATTEDISGLFPGEYCVVVTDADFCVTSPPFCVTIVQIDNPAPVVPADGSAQVACLADAVEPTPPTVVDVCGTVLTPVMEMIDSPDPITCEGTRTYKYTYTDYQPKSSVWQFVYTIEYEDFTMPADAGETVECASNLYTPTPPTVTDNCGNTLTPTGPVVSSTPSCEGIVTYVWTYTDCEGNTHDWTYTFTLEHSTPPAEVGGPAPTASTVECEADAVVPTLPVFQDVCGEVLAPAGPVMSGTYTDCEGTIIYTYTYTDCAGLSTDWVYTYTIQHSTPPAEVGGPVATSSTIECAVDAVMPTLPVFEDVCGNVLTPSASVPGGDYDGCEGTITYTFTYTDCAGLSTDWVYTYNVIHSTPPAEVGAPVPVASTVECAVDAVAPALPVFEDVCGNTLTPTGPAMGGTYVDCEGTITYTYTYTDCAGLYTDWTYTYTVEHSTPPAEVGGPVSTGNTVECAVDAVPPTTLPTVEDVCGVVIPAPTPVMSSTVDCQGLITYTYTYPDCAGLDFVWVYTYTIEHSTPPAEVGGPVETASTVECVDDAVDPGEGYQVGFAGYFDPTNWTLYNTDPSGDGYVDASSAPASILLVGSDANTGTSNYTNYEITIPYDGNLSFDWEYYTYDWDPSYDPFGYTIDGVFNALTDDYGPSYQSGSVLIPVTQGSTFSLTVYSTDQSYGPSVEVTSVFLFTPVTLPVVQDVCGVMVPPSGPVVSGTYDGCEGTKIYTYTYTDCAGLDFVWSYTYTIEHSTPPAEVGGPAPIASTVECITEVVDPVLPVFDDVCGNVLTPTGPVMGGTYVDCEGTVTYTYTYTDCAGLSTDWTYTYTIDDTQAPWIIAPPDITVYMNDGCYATGIGLGAPQKGDNCQNQLFVSTDGLVSYPEGTTTVTWTVTDCAGNSSFDTQEVTVIRNDLSGTLTYDNGPTFGPNKILNNVEITLYDNAMNPLGTDVTDSFGNYSFTGLCAGTYSLAITNNNKPAGGVNITDAGMIMTFGAVANPAPIEKVNWLAGDVNQSGAVNTLDVLGTFNKFVYGNPFGHDWNYYWAGEMTNDANTAPSLPMTVVIGGGNSTMDIYGQCTGDFNGNFAPGTMKSSSENLTLEYRENMLVNPGSEFELPVYAGMDMEVGAISLIMNVPSDEVEITNVYLTSDPSSTLQYNVTGDELRIGWYSLAPVWLNKGESLITLQMKLKSETSAEGIQISLASNDLNELADGDFNVIENASLGIDVPSTSALGTGINLSTEKVDFTSYPNPFKGNVTLTYSLPVEGQVLIEVYDLVGSKVKVAVDEAQSAGKYTLKLDANNMQPGIYTAILKFKTSDDKVISRAIKMINR